MKRKNYARLCSLLSLMILSSQMLQAAPRITLEDIYTRKIFTPMTLGNPRSMKDGVHYTLLKGNAVEQYSYETGEREKVLFSGDRFPQVSGITAYQFNRDEDLILIETGKEKIYRHSYRATYFIYDLKEGTLEPLSGKGKQQLALFSPEGTRVAFVRENNLYIRDLTQKEGKQITFDGQPNRIINGAPDWVYEEEFAFSQGYCWSPDGNRIAFYRFDESRVRLFEMTLYGPLYPQQYRFKYPKAGEENSIVSIHVYDLATGNTNRMDVGTETDQYIPRIKWTADPQTLSIMRMNRLQNRMEILHADAVSGESKLVYQESNDRYISEPTDKTVTYLPDGEHFILNSERSGYFHLYLYNFTSGKLSPITSGDWDVHEFLAYDSDRRQLYYTSYEASTTQRQLYSMGLDGSGKKKLGERQGSYKASFSSSFRYYILEHSSANSPAYITLHNRQGKMIRVLVDNGELRQKMKEYRFSETEFLQVPSENGQELNAWMIRPPDFDPSRQYPLFMYVYGGPESQNVIDSWNRRNPWFQMLAQQGYVVVCVDNRGTNGRGEEFRKATYLKLGELETLDQLEAARWFGSLEYIDADRMGVYGWSYGGYMTSLLMTRGEGTFRMGIAGAPVTSWKYYDTVYTERFMRTPGENPEGYERSAPLRYAADLQGAFLLIHGSADDNVHFQNTMDFITALHGANKQFNLHVYPNKNHSVSRGDAALHLATLMTDFILENL